MKYRIIDGVLYQSVDTSEITQKLDSLVERVRPYKEGIQQCESKIAEYQNQADEYQRQIVKLVQESGIDQEVARAVDPDKASFLGL